MVIYTLQMFLTDIYSSLLDGTYVTQWSMNFGTYDGPANAIAIDAEDRIYVTRTKSISVFTSDGVYLTDWGSRSNGVVI